MELQLQEDSNSAWPPLLLLLPSIDMHSTGYCFANPAGSRYA
jgi:hypothetical protein